MAHRPKSFGEFCIDTVVLATNLSLVALIGGALASIIAINVFGLEVGMLKAAQGILLLWYVLQGPEVKAVDVVAYPVAFGIVIMIESLVS